VTTIVTSIAHDLPLAGDVLDGKVVSCSTLPSDTFEVPGRTVDRAPCLDVHSSHALTSLLGSYAVTAAYVDISQVHASRGSHRLAALQSLTQTAGVAPPQHAAACGWSWLRGVVCSTTT
jgi:hypothetical protein